MLKLTDDGIIIVLKIIPNSSINGFVIGEDKTLPAKLKVTAPPVENKANKAVIEYLSKYFKIPKTSISVIKGETSKEKTILLKTKDIDKVKLIQETLG